MGRSKRQPSVRLIRPLVRDDGVLRPAGWDEALDRAAVGFQRNIAAGGPSAFGLVVQNVFLTKTAQLAHVACCRRRPECGREMTGLPAAVSERPSSLRRLGLRAGEVDRR